MGVRHGPFISAIVAAALVALACAMALGPVLHLVATADEGAHIGPGLQWWTLHRFSLEPKTPPLARIVVGFLPWLWGFHTQGENNVWSEAHAVIAASGNPPLILLLARFGTLLFLVWASVAVWLLGKRAGGPDCAAVAVACFVTLPPVLGSAGIATTDLAQAATFGTLILVLLAYLDAPTRGLAVLFGVAGALTVAAKFTSLTCFPVCLAGVLIWRRSAGLPWPAVRPVLRLGVFSVPVALVVIWAIYDFSIGSLLYEDPATGLTDPQGTGRGWAYAIVKLNVFPAHEFWRGLLDALRRADDDPPDFLLGRERNGPSLLFFPLSFGLKTPIAFLLLLVIGTAKTLLPPRPRDALWVAGLCVILAAMLSVPHLGVRYLLAAYLFFAVTAAQGALVLWRWHAGGRAVVLALALWSGWIVGEERKDYLGWFNAMAGSEPDWYLHGTDTDYGQYGVFLADELRRLNVTDVWLMLSWNPAFPDAYYGFYHDIAELQRAGIPHFTRLPADTPVKGWVAITVESLQKPQFAWLRAFTPVAKVSYHIYIYHID